MKMRWKLLLLLSLISISLVLATSGDDEVENVESVKSDYDEGMNLDVKVAEEEENVNEEKTEENTEDVETDNSEPPTTDEELPVVDEDIVDVDTEPIKALNSNVNGKYSNYDDYNTFNLEASDNSYDWMSEFFFNLF